MRKLLLLDADVVIDLHTLGLFRKISKAYDVYVTQEVYEEATYFKKGGSKNPINIAGRGHRMEYGRTPFCFARGVRGSLRGLKVGKVAFESI
ncbi:MAG: hypothetical protein ABIE47_01740 [Pseudomonadota bacterium]|nr:hypothetical protein [Desulfobacteraceae bacterium]